MMIGALGMEQAPLSRLNDWDYDGLEVDVFLKFLAER